MMVIKMDNDIINNIKALGIDMINTAKSGHPGIVLSAAPILYSTAIPKDCCILLVSILLIHKYILYSLLY